MIFYPKIKAIACMSILAFFLGCSSLKRQENRELFSIRIVPITEKSGEITVSIECINKSNICLYLVKRAHWSTFDVMVYKKGQLNVPCYYISNMNGGAWDIDGEKIKLPPMSATIIEEKFNFPIREGLYKYQISAILLSDDGVKNTVCSNFGDLIINRNSAFSEGEYLKEKGPEYLFTETE